MQRGFPLPTGPNGPFPKLLRSGPLRISQFWLLALIISWLSLCPSPPMPDAEGSDKVLHLLAYLVMFISLDLAHWPRQKLLVKLLALLAFSFLLEVAQSFTPTRQFSLGDLLANLAGLLLGLAVAEQFYRIRRKHAAGRI